MHLERCLLVGLLLGCPKQGSSTLGSGRLSLPVQTRAPIQCGDMEKDETLAAVRTSAPSGCNAAVRYNLAPTGQVDIDLPFYLGADATEVGRRVDAKQILSGEVRIREASGRGRWQVGIPLDRLPWTEAGPCAGPPDPAAPVFDFKAWRLLVVQVRSRDAYGTLNPYVVGQDSSVSLDLTMPSGAQIEPTIVASTEADGIWAAAWCDAGEVPTELRFGVRGAYQLETDRFELPSIAADTYTVIRYIVEPTKR